MRESAVKVLPTELAHSRRRLRVGVCCNGGQAEHCERAGNVVTGSMSKHFSEEGRMSRGNLHL